MRNPLEFIPSKARKPVFVPLLLLTLSLFLAFQALNRPLTTVAAPSGIVSHQMAWTPDKAQAIFDSWDANAKLFAAFGLGFDFLFMPSYAITLALGALLAAGRHPGWFARLGGWMGWAASGAWLFDVLENLGQVFQLMNGEVNSMVTHFVGVCAYAKFTLILLALAYGLIGWLWPKSK